MRCLFINDSIIVIETVAKLETLDLASGRQERSTQINMFRITPGVAQLPPAV